MRQHRHQLPNVMHDLVLMNTFPTGCPRLRRTTNTIRSWVRHTASRLGERCPSHSGGLHPLFCSTRCPGEFRGGEINNLSVTLHYRLASDLSTADQCFWTMWPFIWTDQSPSFTTSPKVDAAFIWFYSPFADMNHRTETLHWQKEKTFM